MIYLMTVTYYNVPNMEVVGTSFSYEEAVLKCSQHFTDLLCDLGEDFVLFQEPIYAISAYQREFVELLTYEKPVIIDNEEYFVVDGPAW